LAAAPGLVCEIRGYGGPKQAAQQNWALALQRALAAEEYLENKGIADWRLSTRAVHAGEAAQGARTDREMDFLVRAKEDVRGRE
jgi:outer membrane protein OmpA-like peptidoglycan-associated protein